MDEDGTTTSMELLPLLKEPLGLSRENLRRVRKRKRAPNPLRKLSEPVKTMAKSSVEELPMGVITQKIWDVIMYVVNNGTGLLKDEATNKKQREREKRIQRKNGPRRSRSARNRRVMKVKAGRDGFVEQIELVLRA